MDFFTNDLLETWHHLMLTRGTIGMLTMWQHSYGATCQHIIVWYNGRLVCTYLCPPYTICTHICIHQNMHCIHHQVYIFMYLYTWITWVWTQDLMEASKCLCHQVTQLFVREVCAIFSFILLTMKQFGNPNFGIFFPF